MPNEPPRQEHIGAQGTRVTFPVAAPSPIMMEPLINEYALTLKARGGDPDAVAALVERTRTRLFVQAHTELGHYDDAQDAVAAALLQVCLHIGDLRQPEHVVPWMLSIVRREARRIAQGRAAAPLRENDLDPRAEDTASTLLRLDIQQALRRMPGPQARAVRLFHLEGRSVREIAAAMSGPVGVVSEGRVRVWLHRGRRHLAAEMKGYEPTMDTRRTDMTNKTLPTPAPHPAAILHTDLTPDLLRGVSDALRGGGFSPQVLSPRDLPDFRADQLPLREALAGYDALVVDETVGGRSGLEYVLFCKAYAETANIPITLLHSQEENALLVTACYTAGVSHLVRKDDLGSFSTAFSAAFHTPDEPKKGSWESFTERARQIVCQAQREAISLNDNCVSTEHLLLGLVREVDCAGARILAEKLGVPLARVAEDVERRVPRGPGRDEALDLILTPRSRNVVDYAQEEAVRLGHRYIGSEHLLLGLIREEDGLAARILAESGVTLEQTRGVVVDWQTEAHQ